MAELYRGTWVALVTPYAKGRVDAEALRRVVRRAISGGVDVLVPCGCTGEGGLLEAAEQELVIRTTIEESAGRVPVVAGTGTQSTEETVALTRTARALGASAAMVITPYYVKPTQEGLYRHYRRVIDEGGLPVVLYNVPGRTSVSITPETVARIAAQGGVGAIKEASGSPEAVVRIRALAGIPVLSGDAALTLSLMAVGASGVVSVAANVVPAAMVSMVDAFAAGRVNDARRVHEMLAPLFRALFLETNPSPVKTALALLGVIRAGIQASARAGRSRDGTRARRRDGARGRRGARGEGRMNGPLAVVVAGVAGRMGREVARLALEAEDLSLAGGLEAIGHPLVGSTLRALGLASDAPIAAELEALADAGAPAVPGVLIEFSLASGAVEHARQAASRGWAVVSGSTGLSAGEEGALRLVSARVPVLRSPNFSRGALALLRHGPRVARELGRRVRRRDRGIAPPREARRAQRHRARARRADARRRPRRPRGSRGGGTGDRALPRRDAPGRAGDRHPRGARREHPRGAPAALRGRRGDARDRASRTGWQALVPEVHWTWRLGPCALPDRSRKRQPEPVAMSGTVSR